MIINELFGSCSNDEHRDSSIISDDDSIRRSFLSEQIFGSDLRL
jgi:hypothetical protein